MNKPSLGSTSVMALMLAGCASLVFVGCGSEAPKENAWTCDTTEVPMGEALRCTQAAVTSDGPPTSSVPGTTTDPSGGTRDGFPGDTPTSNATGGGGTNDGFPDDASLIVFECGPDVLNPSGDCPPPDVTNGTPTPTEPSGDPTGSGGTTDGFPDDTTGGSSSGGSSSGGSSSGGGGNTKDGFPGDTGGGIPTECNWVPDLPYCPPGSGGSTPSGGADGGAPCEGPPGHCDTPTNNGGGNTKDGFPEGSNGGGSSSGGGANGGGSSSGGGASGGGSSSGGGASGGGEHGKPPHFVCTKDKKGNKDCQATPTCVPGTKPAKCGACVPEGEEANDCKPTYEGGCWVTGGGFIIADSTTPAAAADGHDNFGGNAKPMKDGSVKGHWNHVDHGTGGHLNGHPEYIVCRHVDEPGPGQPGGKKGLTANQAYFGGKASWSGADGYWFDVVVKDHGEPGSSGPAQKKGLPPDTYHLTVRLVSDPVANASGTIVYELHGDLEGGNIQMHAPNGGHPASTSSLPAWVSYEP